jgi:hypothetical protein
MLAIFITPLVQFDVSGMLLWEGQTGAARVARTSLIVWPVRAYLSCLSSGEQEGSLICLSDESGGFGGRRLVMYLQEKRAQDSAD